MLYKIVCTCRKWILSVHIQPPLLNKNPVKVIKDSWDWKNKRRLFKKDSSSGEKVAPIICPRTSYTALIKRSEGACIWKFGVLVDLDRCWTLSFWVFDEVGEKTGGLILKYRIFSVCVFVCIFKFEFWILLKYEKKLTHIV